MSFSSVTRAQLTVAISAVATAFGGCNSLLDNHDAQRNDDLFSGLPSDASDGGAETVNEAGRIGDAIAPIARPDAAPVAQPPPPQCPIRSKPCGGSCVSTNEPSSGCGGPTCARCAPAHATAACAAEACVVGTCDPGWADCNGLAADGCETDLSSPTSCGVCGAVCPGSAAPNTVTSCTNLGCMTTCKGGFADCNASLVDGCEADLTSKRHCGGCGNPCLPGAKCEGGVCRLRP